MCSELNVALRLFSTTSTVWFNVSTINLFLLQGRFLMEEICHFSQIPHDVMRPKPLEIQFAFFPFLACKVLDKYFRQGL